MNESERGSGTILSTGLIAVISAFALLLGLLASGFDAKHRADSAADFAALAAAETLHDPFAESDPCAVAGTVVEDAELVSCTIRGDRVVVETRADVRFAMIGQRYLTGKAEAGPT
ncbi:Rv3654c family TadE-like protein [Flaviflexus massiliensis]|uniref:Rv3654c family TadE-like protein n=1 Tax=Flaviflexus massiliensis TaxID=1522309 RepID=UPI0006D52C22|nr:Rv3654c family TadE-like protein [Flaviflexus massiliensis]